MVPPAAARGLSFQGLQVAMLLLGAFVLGCLMPMQNDTWWHLRTGQEILRLGQVPLVEFLSHTAAGREWPNHEWLAQVIYYAAFALGGLPLLALVGAALVTGALGLMADLVPTRWRAACLALALPVVGSCFAVRPHLFTMLLFAVTLRSLARGRLRWLPLVFLAWANLHGGVLVAGPLLGAAGLVALARHRERLRGLIGVSVAWLLATLATPLGPRLWSFVRQNLASPVAAQIVEWQPLSPTDPLDLTFGAQALLLTGLAWRWWRRPDPDADFAKRLLVTAALLFAPLGFRAVRHQLIAALALAPALGVLLPPRRRARETDPAFPADAKPRARPTAPDSPRTNAAFLAACGAVAAGAVAWAWSGPLPRLGWRPISSAAAAAIASCPDPLYNTYNDGGVLLWFVPGKRVFLDSRHDPYPHDLMLAQLDVDRTGAYEALFKRYAIACAVVAPDTKTATRLAQTGWRPSYADERWAVFTR